MQNSLQLPYPPPLPGAVPVFSLAFSHTDGAAHPRNAKCCVIFFREVGGAQSLYSRTSKVITCIPFARIPSPSSDIFSPCLNPRVLAGQPGRVARAVYGVRREALGVSVGMLR